MLFDDKNLQVSPLGSLNTWVWVEMKGRLTSLLLPHFPLLIRSLILWCHCLENDTAPGPRSNCAGVPRNGTAGITIFPSNWDSHIKCNVIKIDWHNSIFILLLPVEISSARLRQRNSVACLLLGYKLFQSCSMSVERERERCGTTMMVGVRCYLPPHPTYHQWVAVGVGCYTRDISFIIFFIVLGKLITANNKLNLISVATILLTLPRYVLITFPSLSHSMSSTPTPWLVTRIYFTNNPTTRNGIVSIITAIRKVQISDTLTAAMTQTGTILLNIGLLHESLLWQCD